MCSLNIFSILQNCITYTIFTLETQGEYYELFLYISIKCLNFRFTCKHIQILISLIFKNQSGKTQNSKSLPFPKPIKKILFCYIYTSVTHEDFPYAWHFRLTECVAELRYLNYILYIYLWLYKFIYLFINLNIIIGYIKITIRKSFVLD